MLCVGMFASGALGNYIDKTDEHNEKFSGKMDMLDKLSISFFLLKDFCKIFWKSRLYKEYVFPLKLYADIRKNIMNNYMRDRKAES